MTLVPPGDPPALAAAIEAVRDDPAQRAGARARTCEANFTWEACGRATVAAYEEALAMSDRRPVLFVTNHAPAFRVGAFRRCTSARTWCSR